jgi:hypothetical protein
VYLLYVDESGVEQLSGGTSHFVLLGLAVRADNWRQLDGNINRIKMQYALSGAEVHTAWMLREYAEQGVAGFDKLSYADRRIAAESRMKSRAGVFGVRGNQKAIKSYRRYWRAIRPYLHLTHAERRSCLLAMATEVGRCGTTRILADAISKTDFDYSQRLTPYEMAFEQVLTRFDQMLRRAIENGERDFWSLVECRVDTIGQTQVGLRHYTGSRLCTCPVCVAHGRVSN